MSDAAEDLASASGAWASLGSFMACPSCAKPLKAIASSAPLLDCLHCGTSYPVVLCGEMQLPWLFADPEEALADWRARLRGFTEQSITAVASIERALARESLKAPTRRRLELLSRALTARRRQVDALLAPLGLDTEDEEAEPPGAARSHPQVAPGQGIDSYYVNLFRDWVWGETENGVLLDIVTDLLERAGRRCPGEMLVLGGGGCRLPYDLARTLEPRRTTVLDINPLLLLTAARVLQGETVTLTEFPLAPLSGDEAAVERTLSAEPLAGLAPPESFRLVFGDASKLPFLPRQFDTLVTPWLIDIIGEDFTRFAARMNQALSSGGIWVNTGSLAFMHPDPARRYGPEEILEFLDEAGFETLQVSREPIPYLRSPASSQARQETVFSFVVRKCRDVAPPPDHALLPEWLTDSRVPIPELGSAVTAASEHLLNAHVLGAVDGRRSVAEIGRLLAAHHEVSIEAATAAVRRILREFHRQR